MIYEIVKLNFFVFVILDLLVGDGREGEGERGETSEGREGGESQVSGKFCVSQVQQFQLGTSLLGQLQTETQAVLAVGHIQACQVGRDQEVTMVFPQ